MGGQTNSQVSLQASASHKKKNNFKANKGSVLHSENVTTHIKANKMADIVDVVDRKRKEGACLVFVLLCKEDNGISLADNRLIDISHLALTWVRWSNGEKLALTCVQI